MTSVRTDAAWPADDRRKDRRFEVDHDRWLEVSGSGQSHPCRIKEISLGGLRLVCSGGFVVGEDLVLEHPDAGLFLGRCVWDAEEQIGFQFRPTCPELEHTLRCVQIAFDSEEPARLH